MRNCPSGPWRPWDSWIWSERAAPLAFGRVSAPPPCGVQASGGARPLGRGVSPPRRRVSFPAMGKKPKDRRGRGRWTTAPLCSAYVHRTAFPGPHYGGRVPVRFYNGSGARSLSDGQRFLPAHWGLVFPKLRTVRFPFCAWLCRGNAPGACIAAGTALAAAWGSWCEFWWSLQGLSYLSMGGLIAVRRGGACPSRRP